MKKLLILTMVVFATGFISCSFDDSDLWNELRHQDGRLTLLEQKVQLLNADIQSIRTIVEVLQSQDMITGISELSDGSGYVINFMVHSPITIKHGQNGADGAGGTTPVIAVAQEGGVYYWTVDGQFMLDASSNKIPVTGNNGADGADAIAPQLRINETTMEWEISADGGITWMSSGVVAQGQDGQTGPQGPAGSDGDSFFLNVDTDNPEYVIFTLSDGTVFEVPRYSHLSLTFTNLRNEVFEVVVNESAKVLEYTKTGTISKIGVANSLPIGWSVKVDANNQILVSSTYVGEAQLLIVATAPDGSSASYWIDLFCLGSTPVAVSSIPALEAALDNAAEGGVIDLAPGTYSPSGAIVIDKNITLRSSDPENTVIEIDGSHPAIHVSSAAAMIDGITVRQTTDAASAMALIRLTGDVDGSVIQNSVFEGSFDLAGGDTQVVRGIAADAGRSLTIIGNRFINVRQPAYIEGSAIIKDNYAEGTKGWVITQNSIVDMTGNTFGVNAVDIAIIQNNIVSDLGNYDDTRIQGLHTQNDNAHVENQVTDNGAACIYNSIRKDGSTYIWPNP